MSGWDTNPNAPSRPRGVRSRDVVAEPDLPHYGERLESLFRRFAKTIPLKRHVKVSYRHHMLNQRLIAFGLPYLNQPAMLYLRVADGSLLAIMKPLVDNIEGAEMPVQPQANPTGEKAVLAIDDPGYEQFAGAIAAEETVRVEYLQKLAPDPAIQDAKLNERGLPTVVEGKAYYMDNDCIFITTGDFKALEMNSVTEAQTLARQRIERTSIIGLTFLGPRDAPRNIATDTTAERPASPVRPDLPPAAKTGDATG